MPKKSIWPRTAWIWPCRRRSMALAVLLHAASLLYWPAQAQVLITRRVTIQPIHVCLRAGRSANPDLRLFEFEADKIWSQAGIDIRFLPSRSYTNNTYFDVSTDPFSENSVFDLFELPGHEQHPDLDVLNMFFVNSIAGGAYAFSYQSDNPSRYFKNGLAIANNTFSYNNGKGRIDTFAHEIGRNLGLDDNNYGAGGSENVMTAGGSRQVPAAVADITPHGRKLDKLSPEQVAQACQSPFVTALRADQQYSYVPPAEEPSPPALAVGTATSNILLSWPASPDYVLQTRRELDQGGWRNVEGSIRLTGANKVFLAPPTPPHQFFQLWRP